MASPSHGDQSLTLGVDESGVVRLRWPGGVRIDGELAARAMSMVDEMNGDQARPLLVDMTRTAELTRAARLTFSRPCSVSRTALLGRSPVDRVIANFALGVTGHPMPIRFFTSEPAAVAWLLDGANT